MKLICCNQLTALNEMKFVPHNIGTAFTLQCTRSLFFSLCRLGAGMMHEVLVSMGLTF